MSDSKRAFERAMRLAAVTGLRAALGPALIQAAYDRPNQKVWALAAMGEMVFDKLPFVPSRASLPAMLPRAVGGGYVAREVMRREGIDDPTITAMGAAVAAGVAALAPRIRGVLGVVLGIPRPLLGLAEDYLALKVGGEALGMTLEDLRALGENSLGEVSHWVESAEGSSGHTPPQPVGAGSM